MEMNNIVHKNYREVIVLMKNGNEVPFPNVTRVTPSLEKIEITQEFGENKVFITLFTKNIAGYSVWG